MNGVKKVSDIIAEIAAASTEQSIGIEQVNKAITRMDQVTQQNAALVEQVAAASESMDEQAKHLLGQIQTFRVGLNTLPTKTVITAAKTASPQGGVERRSSNRPWNPSAKSTEKTDSIKTKASSKKVAVGNDTDDDWDEF